MWRDDDDHAGRSRPARRSLTGGSFLAATGFDSLFGAHASREGRRRSPLSFSLAGRGPGGGSAGETVTCIACGSTVARADAREYDKEGDRWDRRDKAFEHLCKACHREQNHQPREEVEALLVEIGAGECSREEFLEWYCALVEERYGPLDEEP